MGVFDNAEELLRIRFFNLNQNLGIRRVFFEKKEKI